MSVLRYIKSIYDLLALQPPQGSGLSVLYEVMQGCALSTVNKSMVVESMQVLKRRLNAIEAENTRLRTQIDVLNALLKQARSDANRAWRQVVKEREVAFEVDMQLQAALREFRNQVRPGASTPEADRLYDAVVRAEALLSKPDSDDDTDDE